jgi:hypothetical protein
MDNKNEHGHGQWTNGLSLLAKINIDDAATPHPLPS